MIRFYLIASVVLLLAFRAANAQELSGSFTANSSGEDFTVESNGDGTADIYGSDGRHVGQAEDNGDGTWDIQSPSGRNLGQIQDDGDGSFDVYGSQGGYWGSGDSD
jgi:hypothetical protein